MNLSFFEIYIWIFIYSIDFLCCISIICRSYDSLTIHTLLAFVFIADFLSGFFPYFFVLVVVVLVVGLMLNEDIDFQKPVKFMGSIFVSLLKSIEA